MTKDRTNRVRSGFAVAALAIVAAVGAASSTRADASSSPGRAQAFALQPTVRCLTRAGGRVTAIPARDADLKALHDLAQRTSRKLVLRGQTIGFAVVDSDATATLLIELLDRPSTGFLAARRANAIFLYRPANRRALNAAVACLRT